MYLQGLKYFLIPQTVNSWNELSFLTVFPHFRWITLFVGEHGHHRLGVDHRAVFGIVLPLLYNIFFQGDV